MGDGFVDMCSIIYGQDRMQGREIRDNVITVSRLLLSRDQCDNPSTLEGSHKSYWV